MSDILAMLRELAATPLADVEATPHDVLAFNHKLQAKYALDRIENLRRFHDEELARLREVIDTGAHALTLLRQAQQQGRKTVRIADLLAEAEQRHAAGRKCQTKATQ